MQLIIMPIWGLIDFSRCCFEAQTKRARDGYGERKCASRGNFVYRIVSPNQPHGFQSFSQTPTERGKERGKVFNQI